MKEEMKLSSKQRSSKRSGHSVTIEEPSALDETSAAYSSRVSLLQRLINSQQQQQQQAPPSTSTSSHKVCTRLFFDLAILLSDVQGGAWKAGRREDEIS